MTDANSDYWKTYTDLAAAQGINVKLVNSSDCTQANSALSQGQLDVNLFQHILFLTNCDVSNNDTLAPIGSTYVAPLSLYSRKHAKCHRDPAW